MSYQVYKLIHFLGMFTAVAVLAATSMHMLGGGSRTDNPHRQSSPGGAATPGHERRGDRSLQAVRPAGRGHRRRGGPGAPLAGQPRDWSATSRREVVSGEGLPEGVFDRSNVGLLFRRPHAGQEKPSRASLPGGSSARRNADPELRTATG